MLSHCHACGDSPNASGNGLHLNLPVRELTGHWQAEMHCHCGGYAPGLLPWTMRIYPRTQPAKTIQCAALATLRLTLWKSSQSSASVSLGCCHIATAYPQLQSSPCFSIIVHCISRPFPFTGQPRMSHAMLYSLITESSLCWVALMSVIQQFTCSY